MSAELTVLLACGLEQGGMRQCEAVIRPLTGADELAMAERAASATPAERATTLIATATRRIGAVAPVTAEAARALTVGDRERLLLGLHRLSFGGRTELRAHCPAVSCGAEMEVTVALEDLLADLAEGPASPEQMVGLPLEGERLQLRVRPPSGADQEAAACLIERDPGPAADLILERCLLQVTDSAGRSLAPKAVIGRLRAEPSLERALAEIDPAAEITFALACPACGQTVEALLDSATLLGLELARGDGIFIEVDRIARAYHWSEAEIVAMPIARRRRYLALLAATEGSA